MTTQELRDLLSISEIPWTLIGGKVICGDGDQPHVSRTSPGGAGGIYQRENAKLIVAAINHLGPLLDLREAVGAYINYDWRDYEPGRQIPSWSMDEIQTRLMAALEKLDSL